MAEYQLAENAVIRTRDQLRIPLDETHSAYREYLAWADAGGVPDAAVAISITQARQQGIDQLSIEANRGRRRHIPADPAQVFADEVALKGAGVANADGSIAAGEYPMLEAMVPRVGADVAAVATALLAARTSLEAWLAGVEAVYQAALEGIEAALSPAAVQTVLDGVAWPA